MLAQLYQALPTAQVLPERVPDHDATCKVYKERAAGVELAYCSVEGMCHCLPGMKTESPTNWLTKDLIPLGMPNDDIDAMQLSNDFLALLVP